MMQNFASSCLAWLLALHLVVPAYQTQSKDPGQEVGEWTGLVSEFYSNLTCIGDMLCTKEDCSEEKWDFRATYRRRCSCHPKCQDYGLCCINFEATCLGNTNQDVDPSEHFNLTRSEQDVWVDKSIITCMDIHDMIFTYSVFMVKKCKRPIAPGVVNSDVIKCESENITSMSQLIPVISSNESILYKNLHCLKCNGMEMSAITATLPLQAQCSNEYLEANIANQAYASVDLLLAGVQTKDCFLANDLTPLRGYEDWHLCDFKLVSSCNPFFADKINDFDDFQTACEMYTAYVQHMPDNDKPEIWTLYRNYHCALCNGVERGVTCVQMEPNEMIIGPSFGNEFLSFKILLDFSGKTSVVYSGPPTIGCDFSTHVFDALTNECFELPCPQGFILHNSSHCIVNDSIVILEGKQTINEELPVLQVCIFHAPLSPETNRSEVVEAFNYILKKVAGASHVSGVNNRVSSLDCSVTADVEEVITIEVVVANIPYASYYIAREFPHWLDTRTDIEASRLSIREFHRDELLREMRFVIKHDDIEDMDPSRLLLFLPEFAMFVENHDVKVHIELVTEEDGTWSSDVRSVVQIARLFDCSFGLESRVGPVCIPRVTSTSDARSTHTHRAPNSTGISRIESILTVVFSSLSIVALIVSLTLYSIFPSLWNLPTKLLLSLLLCLLFAHVLFMISGLTSLPQSWCTVIAAVQHYSWLGSFAWMNALSINLYLKFRRIGQDNCIPSYTKFSIYGWGLPALVVITCICLHAAGLFQYGQQGSCWIVGGLLLGLSFGLPIGTMMVANVTLFILLVKAINKSMHEANLANETYDVQYKMRIHFKIFSIMGSTWLFGFLSNIQGLDILSYPFIVLACSNGFLVSICFTLNGRFVSTFKDKVASYTQKYSRSNKG